MHLRQGRKLSGQIFILSYLEVKCHLRGQIGVNDDHKGQVHVMEEGHNSTRVVFVCGQIKAR